VNDCVGLGQKREDERKTKDKDEPRQGTSRDEEVNCYLFFFLSRFVSTTITTTITVKLNLFPFQYSG